MVLMRFAVTLLACLGAGLASAQTIAPEPEALEWGPSPQSQRDQGRERLGDVRADLATARERRAALREEIDGLGDDVGRLNRSLVTVAARRQSMEDEVAATERRLLTLSDEEATLRDRLAARHASLAGVLGALQRMGADPPPALLVRPDDALGAMRGAMLLGAAVPKLRTRMDALAADLRRFDDVREAVDTENRKLAATLKQVGEDETRIAMMIETKRAALGESEKSLLEEQKRAEGLAERAQSLSGLIANLEGEIASARKAANAARAADAAREADEAKRLDEARKAIADARAGGGKLTAGVFADTGRIEPAVAFGRAKGLLPLPVAGRIVQRFGDALPTGRTAQTIAIEPPASPRGARVRAPADGWVLYAGAFRSFGKLLILNAGDDYHLVLMGLDRVDVAPGQFVLAGEPLGTMPRSNAGRDGSDDTVTKDTIEGRQPLLYVEFRENGRPVDPAPWWAERAGGPTLASGG